MSNRRPHIPLKLQRDVALMQLGLDPATAELDHTIALARRRRLPDGGYDPPANDPRFMQWLAPETHRRKTFGRGATTSGSDIGEIAKTRRLEKRRTEIPAAGYAASQRAVERPKNPVDRDGRRPNRFPKRKIASRGFDKRKRPMRRR